MGTADKMMHFRWMESIITADREEASGVVGGPGVNL